MICGHGLNIDYSQTICLLSIVKYKYNYTAVKVSTCSCFQRASLAEMCQQPLLSCSLDLRISPEAWRSRHETTILSDSYRMKSSKVPVRLCKWKPLTALNPDPRSRVDGWTDICLSSSSCKIFRTRTSFPFLRSASTRPRSNPNFVLFNPPCDSYFVFGLPATEYLDTHSDINTLVDGDSGCSWPRLKEKEVMTWSYGDIIHVKSVRTVHCWGSEPLFVFF